MTRQHSKAVYVSRTTCINGKEKQKQTKKTPPGLEFILYRYAKCWGKEVAGRKLLERFWWWWSDLCPSPFQYTSWTQQGNKFWKDLLCTCNSRNNACNPANNPVQSTGSTEFTQRHCAHGQDIWILERLNAWYVVEISSHITEGAARYRLLLPLDGVCLTRKVVPSLRLLNQRTNKI